MKVSAVRPTAELDRWRQLQRSDPALDDPFLAPEFTQAVGAGWTASVWLSSKTPAEGSWASCHLSGTALGWASPSPRNCWAPKR